MRRSKNDRHGVLAGKVATLLAGLVLAGVLPAAAQTAISTDGVVESKAGGFKFPDGSVQSSAAPQLGECPTMDPSDEMIWVGGVCIDQFEASLWDAPTGGNQITNDMAVPCSENGQDCDSIWARSVEGVEPRADITWFQAQAALANSGKRLPTSAEWQMAALGTPDPGASPGSEDCNTSSSGPEVAGERRNCVSRWGHADMVGNLWEWVADWDEISTGFDNWSESYGGDGTSLGRAEGDTNTHFPGALLRGGSCFEGAGAGVFALTALRGPWSSNGDIGFRGAR